MSQKKRLELEGPLLQDFWQLTLQYQTWQPLVDDLPSKTSISGGSPQPLPSTVHRCPWPLARALKTFSDAPKISSKRALTILASVQWYAMQCITYSCCFSLRLGRISKVIPLNLGVTSSFDVLVFHRLSFFSLSPVFASHGQEGLTSVSASWPPGMRSPSPGRGPEQSWGSRPSPAAPGKGNSRGKLGPTDVPLISYVPWSKHITSWYMLIPMLILTLGLYTWRTMCHVYFPTLGVRHENPTLVEIPTNVPAFFKTPKEWENSPAFFLHLNYRIPH